MFLLPRVDRSMMVFIATSQNMAEYIHTYAHTYVHMYVGMTIFISDTILTSNNNKKKLKLPLIDGPTTYIQSFLIVLSVR